MTGEQRERLDKFFAKTFDRILMFEERALAADGVPHLSVKEIHVIATVVRLAEKNANTMSQIAEALSISVGALTTAVNTLVQKGYLRRGSHPRDRRLVLVYATESGHTADKRHTRFHSEMLDHVAEVVYEEELEPLAKSLERLSVFFETRAKKEKEAEACPLL